MSFEVHIQRPLYRDTIEVFLIERIEGHCYYIEACGDGILRRTIKAEEGQEIKPFMTFMGRDFEMIRAFSDSINNFLGKPDETFVRGKLEATERHLADMRTLALGVSRTL